MRQELALLQEGPSDSNDTMADDSDEPLGQDLGLPLGGFDMQPDPEPTSKRVSLFTTPLLRLCLMLPAELPDSVDPAEGTGRRACLHSEGLCLHRARSHVVQVCQKLQRPCVMSSHCPCKVQLM